MRFVFLIPPTEGKERPADRSFGCNYGIFPITPVNILSPASILERGDYQVKFLDCVAEGKDASWLREFIRTEKVDYYVFFTVYLSKEIDLKWAKFISYIANSQEFWKVKHRPKIIFMGPEPSYRMNEFLLDENCFVVRGEPEKTIMEFAKAMENKADLNNILSLSWMQNGKIINNLPRSLMTREELDELPFPARHLVKDTYSYYNSKLKGRPTTTILTARGCLGRCIYCIKCSIDFAREIEWKNFNKGITPVRSHSAEYVINEFKEIKKQGYKSVLIIDDSFIDSKKRVMEICEGIKDLGMEFGFLARADMLQDEELLKALSEAGAVFCDIGVESFSQEVLDYIHKDVTAGQQINAILLLQKYGIEPKINILIGVSSLETEENILETVEILKKLNIRWVSFGIATSHPMTELYKITKENNWFATESGDWIGTDPYREGIVDFPNLSHEKLEKLVRECYRRFYLRPYVIWENVKEISNLRILKEKIKSFLNLFGR